MPLLEKKSKEIKKSSMVDEVKEMIEEDPELFEKLSYK